jgi:RNA polymerase sigma-70 factor, ECF subfamily
MAAENFQFVWRCLRRFGVSSSNADDAAQRVFEIATRKLDRIAAGSERAFLFKTTLWVAKESHRRVRRERTFSDVEVAELVDAAALPDASSDRASARKLLDLVLDTLPLRLRTVFVLFELEEMSSLEISQLLEIPVGTVASRLRQARQRFQIQAARLTRNPRSRREP